MEKPADIELLGGEWAAADTSGVSLDDADGAPDHFGRDAETCAHSADAGRGRGNKGVGAKVEIEHERIGAFH